VSVSFVTSVERKACVSTELNSENGSDEMNVGSSRRRDSLNARILRGSQSVIRNSKNIEKHVERENSSGCFAT